MSSFVRDWQQERRKRKRKKKKRGYHDDFLIDRIKDPRQWRHVLLLSMILQGALFAFAFLGYHYKKSEFGCCNLWAICVILIFIAIQWPYYSDWCSKLGGRAQWHRANLYAPIFIFTADFIFWLGGAMALYAHAVDRPFFEMEWSLLTDLEILAFWIATPAFFVSAFILVGLAHMHRNNLGIHYYAPNEGPISLVHLRSVPYSVHGSFNYRNMMGLIARFLRIETSAQADKNLTTVIATAVGAQVPFYAFAGLAYDENKSTFLIIVIVFGLLAFLLNAQYLHHSLSRRNRKVRKWHRQHLYFPLLSLFILVFVYYFTFGTGFFQMPETSGDEEQKYWEDILLELDAAEIVYFTIGVILLFCVLLVQFMLVRLHRKAWAEGTTEDDDGLDYRYTEEQDMELADVDHSVEDYEDREFQQTVRKAVNKRRGDDVDVESDEEVREVVIDAAPKNVKGSQSNVELLAGAAVESESEESDDDEEESEEEDSDEDEDDDDDDGDEEEDDDDDGDEEDPEAKMQCFFVQIRMTATTRRMMSWP